MVADRKIILVVEDEILIRIVAMEALTAAGFHVIEAEHADIALALLYVKALTIHLLFTDIHMPGTMNGLELAHHANIHWPWIGILVTSGHAKPHHSELPVGTRFLAKPYDLEHVVTHSRELCRNTD